MWVASQDYTADVRMSEPMMTQLADAYRKIRNTFRFALSNLFDFDPARDSLPDPELWEMDAWMLRRTGALIRQCREWYDEFRISSRVSRDPGLLHWWTSARFISTC